MSISDQKLHREILSFVYEETKDDFRRDANLRELLEEFEELDMDGLRYHIERLRDNRQVEYRAQNSVQITVEGIEKLDQEGYETLLHTDLRYEILRKAYEEDRGRPHAYIDGDAIFEEVNATSSEISRNFWYLSQKGLIDRTGTSNDFQLEGEGRNRYEQYRDEGIPIPRTHPLQRYTQHTIEQGDREKAENVFRDIVEIARDEVIVVDTYAKGRLYGLMERHIPSIVDVKVLMSDREVGEENIELYREYAGGKEGDVELRYLDYRDEYPFHSREVIRDRESGWIWDHTFADAGDRHHTISQLRPVNLENDLKAFDEAWEAAETVE
jgi:predicted transcriptional regulator